MLRARLPTHTTMIPAQNSIFASQGEYFRSPTPLCPGFPWPDNCSSGIYLLTPLVWSQQGYYWLTISGAQIRLHHGHRPRPPIWAYKPGAIPSEKWSEKPTNSYEQLSRIWYINGQVRKWTVWNSADVPELNIYGTRVSNASILTQLHCKGNIPVTVEFMTKTSTGHT